jgi:hypothetical protein
MLSEIARARRYIAKCELAVSGQRGHDATFYVACLLVHGFALSEADALMLLREWNRSCVPPWSEAELIHKIRSAASATHRLPRGYLLGDGAAGSQTSEVRGQRTSHFGGSPKSAGETPALPRPQKPKFQKSVLARIASKVADIQDVIGFLAERSPLPVDRQDSASVLRHLYAREAGEKVILFNVMESQGQFVWDAAKGDVIQNHHLPTGNDGVWFLPQPVTGEFLPNPRLEGKLSRRSEEAITSWRYAVLESDEADADDWLRCLVQMPFRIASICESGGRSIHALVRLDAASKADWDRLMLPVKPMLITLGADRGALTAVRLSRLPQAMRSERCQRLLYLNPQPSGVPIFQQPIPAAFYSQKSEGTKT